MDTALTYAKEHADRFVDQLTDWLRIPSISTDPEYADDTRRAADWLADDLRRIGVEKVEVMETGGHPHRPPRPLHRGSPSDPSRTEGEGC